MIPIHTLRARLGLLAASFLLVACAGSRPAIAEREDPVATLKEIRARHFDFRAAELELVIEVDNPGESLTLTGADFLVSLQGEAFAAGRTRLSVDAAGGGRTEVLVPVHLVYRELPREAAERANAGRPVLVGASGGLLAQTGWIRFIPFDGQAELQPGAAK